MAEGWGRFHGFHPVWFGQARGASIMTLRSRRPTVLDFSGAPKGLAICCAYACLDIAIPEPNLTISSRPPSPHEVT